MEKLYRCIVDSAVCYYTAEQLSNYVETNNLVIQQREDEHGWYLTFKSR